MKSLHSGLSVLVGLAALLAGSTSIGAQNLQPPVLAVQGGTLIDGNGGAPVANSVVLIQGNRIIAAGPSARVAVPAGAQIINANGKWVVPGLIDAKGNWTWEYGEPYLIWGVTSVMVSGGRNNQGLAERDAINHGIFRGPRLYQTIIGIAGPGPMREGADNYAPGDGARVARTGDEAVAYVRAMVEAGADIITFTNGDGPVDVHAPGVAEAQRLGKGIDFRAMGPQVRAREVCAMGSGIVYVHSGNVGTQIARDEAKWATYIGLPPDAFSEMDEAKVGPMIRALVGCNAYLEPDLMAADRGFHRNWARVQRENGDFLETLPDYYPGYSSQGVVENAKSPETYLTPEQLRVRAAGFRNHVAFLKRLVNAGGYIVAASDTPQTHPGLGVHQELTAFVEDVGLTPMQAIQAASSWVADGFKIADIGRVQAGKLADVLIVDANPLEDILNLRRINTVIKDGKIVDRNYDPNYHVYASMFHNRPDMYFDGAVGGGTWVAAVKQAMWRPNARNGGWNGAGGFDSTKSPTPGIESFAPHTVTRGAGDTVVKLTGFSFVAGSKVLVDGVEVPAKIVSRTEIEATVPARMLAYAGKLDIVVKNPEPLVDPVWGATSNMAHLLVPFEFTKLMPQPKW